MLSAPVLTFTSSLGPTSIPCCWWKGLQMSIWTPRDREHLCKSWEWTDDGSLTLAGAWCPNCLRHPAFKHVILGPAPVGPQRLDTKAKDRIDRASEQLHGAEGDALADAERKLRAEIGFFPRETPVRCKSACNDGKGCGREGLVEVRPPVSTRKSTP